MCCMCGMAVAIIGDRDFVSVSRGDRFQPQPARCASQRCRNMPAGRERVQRRSYEIALRSPWRPRDIRNPRTMRKSTRQHSRLTHYPDTKGTDVGACNLKGPLRLVRRRLAATGRGKHVGRFSYYHYAVAAEVPGTLERLEFIKRQIHDLHFPFNVIKLGERCRISFLRYEHFDVAFPALIAALSCDIEKKTVRHISYQASHNPPILHRKELLLPAHDPRVRTGSRLTQWLEQHGAFRQTKTIGTREGWRRRLMETGIDIPEWLP